MQSDRVLLITLNTNTNRAAAVPINGRKDPSILLEAGGPAANWKTANSAIVLLALNRYQREFSVAQLARLVKESHRAARN
jgi:hypothetical protein